MELKTFAQLQPQDFKEMRQKAGLTGAQASSLIGVKMNSVYSLESGLKAYLPTRIKLVLEYEKIINK